MPEFIMATDITKSGCIPRVYGYRLILLMLLLLPMPAAFAMPDVWESESLDYTSGSGTFDCAGCHSAPQVPSLQMTTPESVSHDATTATVSLEGFENGALLSSWRYQIDGGPVVPPVYNVRPAGGQSSTSRTITFELSDSPVLVRYCLVDADGNTRRWNCDSETIERDDPPNEAPEIISQNPGNQVLTLPDDEFVFTPVATDDVAVETLTVKSSDTSVVTVTAGAGGTQTLKPVSSGSSTITVLATDAAGASDSQTFRVDVKDRVIVIVPPVNTAPTVSLEGVVSGPLVLQVDDSFTFGITAEDAEDDTDTLGFEVSSSNESVATGRFELPGSLLIDAHAAGTASITLKVSDPAGSSGSLTIDVRVERGNSPPEAVADSYVVSAQDSVLNLNVLDNDKDPDGDSLSIELDSDRSAQGFPLSISDNQVRYQPGEGLAAPDSFSYRAKDTAGGVSPSVIVTLQPSDQDGDGAIDVLDNCPSLPNPAQADMDSDDIGDLCDADPDGDGQPGTIGVPFASGQALVESECLLCHLSGTGGAPVFEDDDAWNTRIQNAGGKPEDLLDSVINGLGSMPAFGSLYSTQELLEAIYYLSGFEDTDEELPGEIDDPDRDGIDAALDNCPAVPNPGQADSDGNDVGDACEPLADQDQDGYPYMIDDDDGNANRLPATLPERNNATVFSSSANLRLGRVARAAAESAAYASGSLVLSRADFIRAAEQVFPGVTILNEDRYSSLMGIVNIDVAATGGESELIIALGSKLPLNPVLRVLQPASGEWRDFAVGTSDRLASAPSGTSGCPVISSANYQDALSSGLSCIRLNVQDGGNNDADGIANGQVELIVDIVREAQDDGDTGPDVVDTSPSKGGGSLGSGLLFLLLASVFVRALGIPMRTRS